MSTDNRPARSLFLPIIIIFIILTGIILVISTWLDEMNINHQVLLGANTLYFVLAIFTGFMKLNAVKNPNPNVYVRTVSAISFIKLMVVALAAIIYLFTAGEERSPFAVIAAMGIYVFYMVAETRGAMQLNKKKNGTGI